MPVGATVVAGALLGTGVAASTRDEATYRTAVDRSVEHVPTGVGAPVLAGVTS